AATSAAGTASRRREGAAEGAAGRVMAKVILAGGREVGKKFVSSGPLVTRVVWVLNPYTPRPPQPIGLAPPMASSWKAG
ncbi:MAG: hypothetical protein JWO83_3080, partial [Caulobacteraceae bacterium]|nr:hypothetical protein [Caulobacteraceae bacterium]